MLVPGTIKTFDQIFSLRCSSGCSLSKVRFTQLTYFILFILKVTPPKIFFPPQYKILYETLQSLNLWWEPNKQTIQLYCWAGSIPKWPPYCGITSLFMTLCMSMKQLYRVAMHKLLIFPLYTVSFCFASGCFLEKKMSKDIEIDTHACVHCHAVLPCSLDMRSKVGYMQP